MAAGIVQTDTLQPSKTEIFIICPFREKQFSDLGSSVVINPLSAPELPGGRDETRLWATPPALNSVGLLEPETLHC